MTPLLTFPSRNTGLDCRWARTGHAGVRHKAPQQLKIASMHTGRRLSRRRSPAIAAPRPAEAPTRTDVPGAYHHRRALQIPIARG